MRALPAGGEPIDASEAMGGPSLWVVAHPISAAVAISTPAIRLLVSSNDVFKTNPQRMTQCAT
jgi:hypothetical protein